MKIKMAWAVQSFFLCFLFNLAFAAVVYLMAGGVFEAINVWISVLKGPGAAALPAEPHMTLGNLGALVIQGRSYALAVLAALASAFTLLMWFFVFLAGGRQIRRAGQLAGLSLKPGPRTDQSG